MAENVTLTGGLDLDADVDSMPIADLLSYQQELTRFRLAVVSKAREVAAKLDEHAEAIEERRRGEAALLGQVNKPPTQYALGEPDDEAPTGAEGS